MQHIATKCAGRRATFSQSRAASKLSISAGGLAHSPEVGPPPQTRGAVGQLASRKLPGKLVGAVGAQGALGGIGMTDKRVRRAGPGVLLAGSQLASKKVPLGGGNLFGGPKAENAQAGTGKAGLQHVFAPPGPDIPCVIGDPKP